MVRETARFVARRVKMTDYNSKFIIATIYKNLKILSDSLRTINIDTVIKKMIQS